MVYGISDDSGTESYLRNYFQITKRQEDICSFILLPMETIRFTPTFDKEPKIAST